MFRYSYNKILYRGLEHFVNMIKNAEGGWQLKKKYWWGKSKKKTFPLKRAAHWKVVWGPENGSSTESLKPSFGSFIFKSESSTWKHLFSLLQFICCSSDKDRMDKTHHGDHTSTSCDLRTIQSPTAEEDNLKYPTIWHQKKQKTSPKWLFDSCVVYNSWELEQRCTWRWGESRKLLIHS